MHVLRRPVETTSLTDDLTAKMLQVVRMAAMQKLWRSTGSTCERQVWAGSVPDKHGPPDGSRLPSTLTPTALLPSTELKRFQTSQRTNSGTIRLVSNTTVAAGSNYAAVIHSA